MDMILYLIRYVVKQNISNMINMVFSCIFFDCKEYVHFDAVGLRQGLCDGFWEGGWWTTLEQRKDRCDIYICINDRYGHTVLFKTFSMFIFEGLCWRTGPVFFFPVSMMCTLDHVRSSGGAAVGIQKAFVDLGMALGQVIMALIVLLTGYPVTFLCLALICLIDLYYFRFYVRRRNSVALMA
jgi:hypothetical protein